MTKVVAQLEEDNQIKRSSYIASHPGKVRTPEVHMTSSSTPASAAVNTDDIINIVWSESSEIFYKRSVVDFQPPTKDLSNNPTSASRNPEIATSGNNVHVVWHDDITGNSDIFYARSTDGGATFGSIINLSMNSGISFFPAIAVSGNNIFVVWADTTQGDPEIFYRRSTNGGTSFGSTENISFNGGSSGEPAVVASGNNVHVVWQDNTPGNVDIFYRRSTDGGTSFGEPTKNLSSNIGLSSFPAIAISGNNVHVAWQDNTPGNLEILYRRSTNSGSTFPNIIKNLSGNTGQSVDPAVATSGNSVHVVWRDEFHIFYRRSLDGGTTFPNIIKDLSTAQALSIDPDIAALANNVYVVWDEDTTLGNNILYKRSTDGGATFADPTTDLSENPGNPEAPSIAVS